MLTYIMSPVRSIPSIDEQLARARQDSIIMPSNERSEVNAKDTTQSFSQEKLTPLATHTNPQSKPGVTFAAQDKLPKLPIPDLESTCKKYLSSLDPLQTAREHLDSERAVQEFLRTDGPELQDRLKTYSAGKSSYIEQFCKQSSLRSPSATKLTGQGTIHT